MLQISIVCLISVVQLSVSGRNASYSIDMNIKNPGSSIVEINSPNKSNICSTEICLSESQKMLASMDDTIDPCVDFYEFSCGKFQRNTEIPGDKESVTAFTMVQDKVHDQMSSILNKPPHSTETNAFKLVQVFAKSCFHDKQLNKNGKFLNYFLRNVREIKRNYWINFRNQFNGERVGQIWWMASG